MPEKMGDPSPGDSPTEIVKRGLSAISSAFFSNIDSSISLNFGTMLLVQYLHAREDEITPPPPRDSLTESLNRYRCQKEAENRFLLLRL